MREKQAREAKSLKQREQLVKKKTGAKKASAKKTGGSGSGSGSGGKGVVGAAATGSWSELCELESEQRAAFSSKIQDKASKAEVATKTKSKKPKVAPNGSAKGKPSKSTIKGNAKAAGSGGGAAIGALEELAREEERRRGEFRARIAGSATAYAAAPSGANHDGDEGGA